MTMPYLAPEAAMPITPHAPRFAERKSGETSTSAPPDSYTRRNTKTIFTRRTRWRREFWASRG
jgi:hypothetical protein